MGCSGSKVATKYEDHDWKELPEDAKTAAKFLGYTKSIWDKDGKVPCEANEWEELTPEQQQAASVLGFDQQSWNAS